MVKRSAFWALGRSGSYSRALHWSVDQVLRQVLEKKSSATRLRYFDVSLFHGPIKTNDLFQMFLTISSPATSRRSHENSRESGREQKIEAEQARFCSC